MLVLLLLLSLLAVPLPLYASPAPAESEPETEPEPETPTTEPEPEPEPEPTPPSSTEPEEEQQDEEALTSQDDLPLCDGSPRDCITNDGNICLEGQGGHECECEEDMSDCPNHPSQLEEGPPVVTEPREPLPSCNLVPRAAQNFACHDRRDYDDITGLYPCNDGTQEADFLDCEDVSGADYDEFLNQPPIDPCLLDPDNSPTCPPPVDGRCPEGYAMNESGNCFPRHERCPTGYHSHEDDESGRCIPDSTPCDEGYIMNPSFPSCELKERVCSEFPNAQGCKSQSGGDDDDDDDDNEQRERHKTIIKNINIRNTIHNTADFPEVDVIGLGLRDSDGDAMVCIMNIDNDWVQCQQFGVPDNRINEDIWRVIETDSDQDYDNGNTGSDQVDDAIDAIKAYDFTELTDSLDNHDFGVDLAALGINPIGEGLVCLVEDDRNEGTALCEPFKIDSAAVSGQITEITEFT